MNRSNQIFRPIGSDDSNEDISLPEDNNNYIHIPILCCSGCVDDANSNDGSKINEMIESDDDDERLRVSSSIRGNSAIRPRPPLLPLKLKPRLFFSREREEEQEDTMEGNNNNTYHQEDHNDDDDDIEDEEMEIIYGLKYVTNPSPSFENMQQEETQRPSAMTEEEQQPEIEVMYQTVVRTPPPQPSASLSTTHDEPPKSDLKKNDDFLSFIPLPRNHKRLRSFSAAEKRKILTTKKTSTKDGTALKEPKRRSFGTKAA